MGGFKEFMTKQRIDPQIGTWTIFVYLMGERRRTGGIQIVTAACCTFAFAAGLIPQLYAGELRGPDAVLMVAGVLVLVAQQVYYTRRDQNYFQLQRAQYEEDKEREAIFRGQHPK